MCTGTAVSCQITTATTADMYVYTLFTISLMLIYLISIYSTNKSIDTSSIHNIWSDIQATLKTFNTVCKQFQKLICFASLYRIYCIYIFLYIYMFIYIYCIFLLEVQMTKNSFFKKRNRSNQSKVTAVLGQSEMILDFIRLTKSTYTKYMCKKINNVITRVQISTIAHSFKNALFFKRKYDLFTTNQIGQKISLESSLLHRVHSCGQSEQLQKPLSSLFIQARPYKQITNRCSKTQLGKSRYRQQLDVLWRAEHVFFNYLQGEVPTTVSSPCQFPVDASFYLFFFNDTLFSLTSIVRILFPTSLKKLRYGTFNVLKFGKTVAEL